MFRESGAFVFTLFRFIYPAVHNTNALCTMQLTTVWEGAAHIYDTTKLGAVYHADGVANKLVCNVIKIVDIKVL